MNTTATIQRERRTSLKGSVEIAYDGESTGKARWMDVSRVGACIYLGRYLRPGRTLTLRFESPLVSNRQLEVTARVVWCRPEKNSPHYTVGLLIQRDTPEMALDFAALGYSARSRQAVKTNKKEVPKVPVTVWPGFSNTKKPQTNPMCLSHVAQAV